MQHLFTIKTVQKITLCLKKTWCQILAKTSLLTDFANFFTVGNRNELSTK